jgi:hypothetical protein
MRFFSSKPSAAARSNSAAFCQECRAWAFSGRWSSIYARASLSVRSVGPSLTWIERVSGADHPSRGISPILLEDVCPRILHCETTLLPPHGRRRSPGGTRVSGGVLHRAPRRAGRRVVAASGLLISGASACPTLPGRAHQYKQIITPTIARAAPITTSKEKWPSIKTQRPLAWRRPTSVSAILPQQSTTHRQPPCGGVG